MSSLDLGPNNYLKILQQVLMALKSFEGKYEKKFNYSKLASYLRLSERTSLNFINFFLEIQEDFKEFSRIFQDHELSLKHEGGTTYLTAKKIYNELPETIILKKEHVEWLSDMIYTFKHVKKGKGFDLKKYNVEMIKHLQLMMDYHPYFFIKNGNALIYPSRLALELGNILLTYKKLNKNLDAIEILNSNIRVE